MRKVSLLVALTLFTIAGTARAQDEAAAAPVGDPAAAPAADPTIVPPADATPVAVAAVGGDYVSAPLTTSAGALKVTLPVVLNLSKSAVLKPVWIPLVLAYGVTDQLEVFVSHTGVGTPIALGASPSGRGGGVCLGGTSRNCEKFYNNVNLGAQFSFLRDNGIELAGIGALEFRRLSSPMHLAVDVGVNFKYASGPVSIRATPVIGIGVNKRSADNNKEDLSVPVQIAFQAAPVLAVFVDSGIYGPTTDFSKNYTVPVGLGAAFSVQPGLDVGAEFLLPMVVRGSFYKDAGVGAADARYLGVFATYRTK
jgi:hypothetical protein